MSRTSIPRNGFRNRLQSKSLIRKGGCAVTFHDSVELVLRQKGFHVFTVNPHVTVYEALEKMADRDIGALVVMNGFDFAGLFFERDCVRKVILKGHSSKEFKVHEIHVRPGRHREPEEHGR